jgi:hypothetical protein
MAFRDGALVGIALHVTAPGRLTPLLELGGGEGGAGSTLRQPAARHDLGHAGGAELLHAADAADHAAHQVGGHALGLEGARLRRRSDDVGKPKDRREPAAGALAVHPGQSSSERRRRPIIAAPPAAPAAPIPPIAAAFRRLSLKRAAVRAASERVA